MVVAWYRQTFTDWVAIGVIISPLVNVALVIALLRSRFGSRR